MSGYNNIIFLVNISVCIDLHIYYIIGSGVMGGWDNCGMVVRIRQLSGEDIYGITVILVIIWQFWGIFDFLSYPPKDCSEWGFRWHVFKHGPIIWLFVWFLKRFNV